MLSASVLKQCIAGKDFRTNQAIPERDDDGRPVLVNGKPKVKYVPNIRAMKPTDVLNSYETDEHYVVVSNDGSKYRIPKSGITPDKKSESTPPATPPAQ